MRWWAELWNDVAKYFGYAEWNWGSAAEWFGAIGTVGALFLGFALLMRELSQAKRRDADSLVTFWQSKSLAPDGRPQGDMTFHHAGTSPVFFPTIVAPPHEDGTPILGYFKNKGDAVHPGDHGTVRVTFDNMDDLWAARISFYDGRGRHWLRGLSGGGYIRERRSVSDWFSLMRYKAKRAIDRRRGSKTSSAKTSADG